MQSYLTFAMSCLCDMIILNSKNGFGYVLVSTGCFDDLKTNNVLCYDQITC